MPVIALHGLEEPGTGTSSRTSILREGRRFRRGSLAASLISSSAAHERLMSRRPARNARWALEFRRVSSSIQEHVICHGSSALVGRLCRVSHAVWCPRLLRPSSSYCSIKATSPRQGRMPGRRLRMMHGFALAGCELFLLQACCKPASHLSTRFE